MSKEVKISQIKIDVNGKELSFSLKEAKQLKEILDDLFQTKTVNIKEIIRERDYYPWIPQRPYHGWQVTCDSNSSDIKGTQTLCLSTNTN